MPDHAVCDRTASIRVNRVNHVQSVGPRRSPRAAIHCHRRIPMRRFVLATHAAIAAVTLFAASSLLAQERFPSKPVRILVPFAPGSLTDLVARLYAERLTTRLGQTVLVENRAGAGGTLAAQLAATATPDGHTLMMVSSGHAANPALFSKLPFDTLRDFAGVTLIGGSPTVIITHAGLGAKSLKDLIAIARQKPGKLNWGSAGAGSAMHLAGEYFRAETKTDMAHISYKGASEVMTDVMTGRIDTAFPPVSVTVQHVTSGRLVALATTGSERSPLLPDVPTARESGLPGFEYAIWYGLVAPAKTPRATLELLHAEMQTASDDKVLRQTLTGTHGVIMNVLGLEKFDSFIRAEIERLGALIRASGIKPE
jgi:tripartite-type tricarboxylate transporter receptor subunit TctC